MTSARVPPHGAARSSTIGLPPWRSCRYAGAMRLPLRTLGKVLALLALSALVGCGGDEGGTSTTGGEVPRKPMFLVANSRGDDVLRFEQETGAFVDVFITKGTEASFTPTP